MYLVIWYLIRIVPIPNSQGLVPGPVPPLAPGPPPAPPRGVVVQRRCEDVGSGAGRLRNGGETMADTTAAGDDAAAGHYEDIGKAQG